MPARRSQDPTPGRIDRPRSGSPLGAALASVGLVLAVVVPAAVALAAGSSSGSVLSGGRLHGPTITPPTTTPLSEVGRGRPRATREAATAADHPWVHWLEVGVELVVGALLLGLVAAWAWPRLRRWWTGRGRAPAGGGTLVATGGGEQTWFDEDEVVAAVGDARRELVDDAGGVVGAWLRFEEACARSGAGRRPWETSGELAVRVLRDLGADEVALRRLHALYDEARWSSHPLGSAERSAALRCLDQVEAGLSERRRAGRRTAGAGERA